MTDLTVAETAALLQRFDDVLILTHVRPDGDTVGCAAALCLGLRALGKRAYLLHNSGQTRTTAPYFQSLEAPEDFVPAKIVSTDIASLGLLPEIAQRYRSKIDLAIDHHPSTDTGCFQYSNTSANTHAVAAALLDTGIDYRAVNKVFFRTKSRKRMALEGDMLANMEFYDHERVVVLKVPISLMERVGADEGDAEDLSALGGQIEGCDCAITMRELEPDVWKFSVRTGSRVNASAVCAELGGGGHAAAAGCTVEAPLVEAKRRILAAVEKIAGPFSD